MRHFKTFFTKGILSLLFAISSMMYSQETLSQNTVTGTVKDNMGEPLIGVAVQVRGTSTGTVTDMDGRYTLVGANANATLAFSYVGFTTQEIELNGRRTLDVILLETSETLDEIVVVGFGTQRRISVSAAVSQIDGSELLKAPTANITNLLGGRLPGVVSLQQSGQPGSDGAALLVRGSSAKYIVDGIPRSISEIDPNDIASISVLKDASSAAVYGLDASAVIIVTTRRGAEGTSRITFTGTYGASTNAQMLQMLDGPQYAYWYNKARELDGDTPIFSSTHVQKMLNNEDGWGNTDWYAKTFGVGTNSNVNVNASGGTDRIKYFVSLGNFNQTGNVSGFGYNRINARSNIDAKIANNLSLAFNLSGRVEERERPFYSAAPGDWNNIPQQAIRALPFVPETIDGYPVSTRTASSFVNPLAASDLTGYHRSRTNVVQTNFSLNYDVPFIEGLSAKFLLAYDFSDLMSKQFSTPYQTMVANVPTNPDGNISYSKSYDARGNNASLTEGLTHSRSTTTNTSLFYTNKFGLHSLSVLALMETIQGNNNRFSATGVGFDIFALDELNYATLKDRTTIGGMSGENRQAGFLGRLNYGYADKYLLEVSTRYDGSYLFAGRNISGKRWVLTPAASAAWRISEEDWFKNSFEDTIDNLKLRGSVGLTALTNDLPAYFYLNTLSFLTNNNVNIPAAVIGGTAVNGLNTSNPANINLTWAKSLQYNAGFDINMWQGMLGLEFDVFYKYIYDIPARISATYPDSFGGFFYGFENSNKQDHKGFEFNLTHRNRIGNFSYYVGINGTYAKRRWLKYNDSENTPDWLKLTGKEVGAQVGYIAMGLFQSQEEIDNWPIMQGRAVRVGDIKYLDRNGDGVISYEQDRGYVGRSAYPDFMGGITLGANWKGIDMSMLWQAALGRDVALTGVYSDTWIMDNTSMTKPFYHGGNSPVYLVENSWTEENRNAEFPRLSIVQASTNNGYSSTFWYRKGDYLRLKSMQIGYNIPQNILKSAGVNALRIYVEGQNLLTFSELTKYSIDPEQPGVSNGYYPQQKVYSVGLNLTF
ncbi:MAG: TonB-dependent receptor [Dysgonamonadaceae bacterium]|nr:TonB-dependent receptor [Dysgonamonadaceae bacterium]